MDAHQIKDLLCELKANKGSIDLHRIEQLVTSDVAPCYRACKSNVRNPSCFCGLVPPEGGFRKKGLWQKDSAVLGSIGRDPKEDAREVRPVCAHQAFVCQGPFIGGRRRMHHPAPFLLL